MMLDAFLTFSQDQAVTGTAASTNEVDLNYKEIGDGNPVFLYTHVNETFTAAGAATLTVALQDSPDGNTWSDVMQSAPIALADLKAGDEPLKVSVPYGVDQHLRLNYTVASGPMTAGKLYAGLRWT